MEGKGKEGKEGRKEGRKSIEERKEGEGRKATCYRLQNTEYRPQTEGQRRHTTVLY
jgi:hypothetical protein